MSLKLRNIISMEDGEYEDVAPETAEAAVDEVEATEVADEITEETDAMDAYSEELDETVEDVQELEETQEVLETALENPDYEGLDEVSAEMIGQRLRVIGKRRGFDVDHIAGAFSKESFNTRTSGRRRKTEIALEGIKDTLVKMWERIKAAIKAIWQAIKDFWKKHISTMGRLLKALEKTKRRARDVNGSPSGEAPKAPSGLQKAFYIGSSNAITAKHVKDTIETQSTALTASEKILDDNTKHFEDIVKEVKDGGDITGYTIKEDKNVIGRSGVNKFIDVVDSGALGSKEKPLVNGWFAEIDEEGLSETKKTFEFKWDQREIKPSDKRTVSVASKKDMEDVCESTIKLIKATQRFGDSFNKTSSKYDQAMNKLSQTISSFEGEDEANKTKRENITTAMRLLNDTARLLPKINSKVAGLNVSLGKQVISFCNTCMGNYKEH